MSRRDYEAFARILHELRENESPAALGAIDGVTLAIADLFAADNQRFDKARFLAAAGMGGE